MLVALAIGILHPVAAAATAIRPADAAKHIGEEAVVEGPVESVVCSPLACLLSFEPGFSGLVVAIPGSELSRFPDPRATFEAQRVRVRGTIIERNGRPRIEVSDPGAITKLVAGESASTIVSTPADPPEVAAAKRARMLPPVTVPEPATAPVSAPRLSAEDAAARVGIDPPSTAARGRAPAEGTEIGVATELRLLRGEIAGLVERVAALEDQLAEADERLAYAEGAIAAAGVEPPPDVRGPPSYVVSGELRPSMHRVRRGWRAERVIRLLGEPLRVTGNPPGPFTWYYDEGRAVTVNEHGLVVSAIGF